MDEVEKFAAFMLEQEVSSRVVQVARQQKLTKNTIRYMRESDLEKLFPALGDQLQFRPIMEMLKVSSPPPPHYCTLYNEHDLWTCMLGLFKIASGVQLFFLPCSYMQIFIRGM